MLDASLYFAEWLTCLPFYVSDRHQSSSAMTGFKPNDNAKDINGTLLRLARLLLRSCGQLNSPLPLPADAERKGERADKQRTLDEILHVIRRVEHGESVEQHTYKHGTDG